MARSKKNVPVEEEQVSLAETTEVAEEVVAETNVTATAEAVAEEVAQPISEAVAEESPEETVLEGTAEEFAKSPVPDTVLEEPDTPADPVDAPASEVQPQKPTEAQESGDTADQKPQAQDKAELPEAEDDGIVHLTLSFPKAMFDQSPGSVERLRAAIASKQTLLKKALNTESLEVVVNDDRVEFPWFTFNKADSAEATDAYSKLVVALSKKAITQTRVSSEEKVPDDLRLGMRLYLINLDFIGPDFASARAFLMRNFPTGKGGGSVRNANFTFSAPEVVLR